jgi:hypothetical protein
VFLDAIGVPQGSVRRNGLRGIYDRTTFNQGVANREVEVLLLDERYERVPLPCHTRKQYCQGKTAKRGHETVRFHAWWIALVGRWALAACELAGAFGWSSAVGWVHVVGLQLFSG